MTMARDPLGYLRTGTAVPVLVSEHPPQRRPIIVAFCELFAQIRQKRVKLPPSWTLLAVFGKLVGTQETTHGLATHPDLPGNLVDADALSVQLAHLAIPSKAALAALCLEPLLSRVQERR